MDYKSQYLDTVLCKMCVYVRNGRLSSSAVLILSTYYLIGFNRPFTEWLLSLFFFTGVTETYVLFIVVRGKIIKVKNLNRSSFKLFYTNCIYGDVTLRLRLKDLNRASSTWSTKRCPEGRLQSTFGSPGGSGGRETGWPIFKSPRYQGSQELSRDLMECLELFRYLNMYTNSDIIFPLFGPVLSLHCPGTFVSPSDYVNPI